MPGMTKKSPENPNDARTGIRAIFKHQGRILLLLVISWAGFILYITLVGCKAVIREDSKH